MNFKEFYKLNYDEYVNIVWNVFKGIYSKNLIIYTYGVESIKTNSFYKKIKLASKDIYLICHLYTNNTNILYVNAKSEYYLINNKYIAIEKEFNEIGEEIKTKELINIKNYINNGYEVNEIIKKIEIIEDNIKFGVISDMNEENYEKGEGVYRVILNYYIDINKIKSDFILKLNKANIENEIKDKIRNKLNENNKIKISQIKNKMPIPIWTAIFDKNKNEKILDVGYFNCKIISDNMFKIISDNEIYFWINRSFNNWFLKGCYGFYDKKIYETLNNKLSKENFELYFSILLISYLYSDKIPFNCWILN